ncbi:MAG: carbamoyl-phosphate synthase large subunit, partial [Desulfocapsaceae bacterium]
GLAIGKALLASGSNVPEKGNVFISVRDSDKQAIVAVAAELKKMGYTIFATDGTNGFLLENDIDSHRINKISQGRPHILDMVRNREINWIINTSMGRRTTEDSYQIRRAAIDLHIPYTTTTNGAAAFVSAMKAFNEERIGVKPVQKFA